MDSVQTANRPAVIARQHVFTPEFYFHRWTGDDGKLCRLHNVLGSLGRFRIAPSDVTIAHEIYTDLRDFNGEERERIDRNFVEPLTHGGERVMSRLVTGTALDELDVILWSLFLASLHQRPAPTRLGHVPANDTPTGKPTNSLLRSEASTEALAETPPATEAPNAAGWHKVARPRSLTADFAGVLPGPAIDLEVLRRLPTFDWYLLDIADYLPDPDGIAGPLLTSDRPCIYTRPIDDPECVVALPLSPTFAFFAMAAGSFATPNQQNVAEQKQLAAALNISVVSQTKRNAFCRDTSDANDKFLRHKLPFDDES